MSKRKNRKVGKNQEVEKVEKLNCRVGNHMTKVELLPQLLPKQGKNKVTIENSGLFSMFVSATIFCKPTLFLFNVRGSVGLTVSVTIGKVEFIGGEIAVGFSGYSL